MSRRIPSLSYFFLSTLLLGCSASESGRSYQADVVIYGGTSAAVSAAVQVTRMDKTVIVVSPDKHLGGLSSGGLGFTDTGRKEVIGGLAREFYHRVWQHYQKPEAWRWQDHSEYGNRGQGTAAIDGEERTMWIFEPHVAELIFEDFIAGHNIRVYRDEWLDRESGVEKEGRRIKSIKTLSGNRYDGRMFIDATYEGDLMAASGVSYHVGRESSATYDEEWNGVQIGVLHHKHWFAADIDPYVVPGDPASGLLFGVSGEPPAQKGDSDRRVQAYCFRMCLSRHSENRVPFPRPDGYDPATYELLGRVFDSGWDELFEKFDAIPNLKTDTNNHGPFSTDNIGMNYDYPEATYERRKEIVRQHENYQKGLMYYLSHDERVPPEFRSEMANWGLAKDEFADNGNWPHQLYVREARRMAGAYVMTQHDVESTREVPEPVGMGSYTIDSHNVQRYLKPDGYVQNEGDIGVGLEQPYLISYRSLIPGKEECENLLVPVCVSSSHIAFGSIRMEPVFMILGQSAATAAVLALNNGSTVQNVDYAELRQHLLDAGQVLSHPVGQTE